PEAVLAGPRSEYLVQSFQGNNGAFYTQVVDQGASGDGTHTMAGSGQLQFSDQTIQFLTGSVDADTLTRWSQADIINGFDGNDTLTGGAGADTMIGGIGNDLYFVDNLGDIVSENSNEGGDTVVPSVSGYVLPANVENAILGTTGAISGNGLANALYGTAGH